MLMVFSTVKFEVIIRLKSNNCGRDSKYYKCYLLDW